jgi:hypothetical protein
LIRDYTRIATPIFKLVARRGKAFAITQFRFCACAIKAIHFALIIGNHIFRGTGCHLKKRGLRVTGTGYHATISSAGKGFNLKWNLMRTTINEEKNNRTNNEQHANNGGNRTYTND